MNESNNENKFDLPDNHLLVTNVSYWKSIRNFCSETIFRIKKRFLPEQKKQKCETNNLKQQNIESKITKFNLFGKENNTFSTRRKKENQNDNLNFKKEFNIENSRNKKILDKLFHKNANKTEDHSSNNKAINKTNYSNISNVEGSLNKSNLNNNMQCNFENSVNNIFDMFHKPNNNENNNYLNNVLFTTKISQNKMLPTLDKSSISNYKKGSIHKSNLYECFESSRKLKRSDFKDTIRMNRSPKNHTNHLVSKPFYSISKSRKFIPIPNLLIKKKDVKTEIDCNPFFKPNNLINYSTFDAKENNSNHFNGINSLDSMSKDSFKTSPGKNMTDSDFIIKERKDFGESNNQIPISKLNEKNDVLMKNNFPSTDSKTKNFNQNSYDHHDSICSNDLNTLLFDLNMNNHNNIKNYNEFLCNNYNNILKSFSEDKLDNTFIRGMQTNSSLQNSIFEQNFKVLPISFQGSNNMKKFETLKDNNIDSKYLINFSENQTMNQELNCTINFNKNRSLSKKELKFRTNNTNILDNFYTNFNYHIDNLNQKASFSDIIPKNIESKLEKYSESNIFNNDSSNNNNEKAFTIGTFEKRKKYR